jgi:hypothetical protein
MNDVTTMKAHPFTTDIHAIDAGALKNKTSDTSERIIHNPPTRAYMRVIMRGVGLLV